jgi:hypothetical protein
MVKWKISSTILVKLGLKYASRIYIPCRYSSVGRAIDL